MIVDRERAGVADATPARRGSPGVVPGRGDGDGAVIPLAEGGYSLYQGDYWCWKCSSERLRDGR